MTFREELQIRYDNMVSKYGNIGAFMVVIYRLSVILPLVIIGVILKNIGEFFLKLTNFSY